MGRISVTPPPGGGGGGGGGSVTAYQVAFDGSGASLSATDVQAGVVEVANNRVASIVPGFGIAPVEDGLPVTPHVGLSIAGAAAVAPGAVLVVNSAGDGLGLRYALVGDQFEAIESPILGDVIGRARLHDPVTGASLGYVPVYNMISA